ncbi:MAG: hypothetical protein IKA43_02795 [Clostridia bacterium]|nr:hypothetical protein [Clostridia bacterium]MBR2296315.1 hypothetical protein [Clostridia bacterium]
MAKYVFGIDFGTTHTSIACAEEGENGALKRFAILTGAERFPSYICPFGDLADPTLLPYLPHNDGNRNPQLNCKKMFYEGDEVDIKWVVGLDAYLKYEEFLTKSSEQGEKNKTVFGSSTVPAGVKTILMKHLKLSDAEIGDRYEVFADTSAEYKLEPSEFFTTMYFKELFMRAARNPAYADRFRGVTSVKFVIGTPPGCGSEYAEQLKKCVKNGFYLTVKEISAKTASSLKMLSTCIPEPLLAGYAWLHNNSSSGLAVGETAFIVDIGAGTTDWTFVQRSKSKPLTARSYDDEGNFIISSGTGFNVSAGNSYDKAIQGDLIEHLIRCGVTNGTIHEQMARGVKELLSSDYYVKVDISKVDPGSPLTITRRNRTTEAIASPRFHIFKRPNIRIEDDDELRYITFDEFRNLEELAKGNPVFEAFLDERGMVKDEYYYEPSPNPELDMFFDDLLDNDDICTEKRLLGRFDAVAESTLEYFTKYKFKSLPKLLFVGNSSNIDALKRIILDRIQTEGAEFVRPNIVELAEQINTSLHLKTSINFFNGIAIGACLALRGGREKRDVTPPLRMYVVCNETNGSLTKIHMHAFVNSVEHGQVLSPYYYSATDIEEYVLDEGERDLRFFFSEGGNLKYADTGEIVADSDDIDHADYEDLFIDRYTRKMYYIQNGIKREVVDEGIRDGHRWPSDDTGKVFFQNLFKISLKKDASLIIVASNHSDNTIIYLLQKLRRPLSFCQPFIEGVDRELTVFNYQNNEMYKLDVVDASGRRIPDNEVNLSHFFKLKDNWMELNKYLYVCFKIGGREKRKFDPFKIISPEDRDTDDFEIYKPFNTNSKGEKL